MEFDSEARQIRTMSPMEPSAVFGAHLGTGMEIMSAPHSPWDSDKFSTTLQSPILAISMPSFKLSRLEMTRRNLNLLDNTPTEIVGGKLLRSPLRSYVRFPCGLRISASVKFVGVFSCICGVLQADTNHRSESFFR